MSSTARGPEAKAAERSPTLSLILCSRNDQYLGNSRHRLETALNYVAQQIEKIGRLGDVEVVVTDWGSDVPLADVLSLTATAATLVRFLPVPPALARQLQGDSAFPEVLALNAGARRAAGRYIGRIDQDTLVGQRFLREFLKWAEGEVGEPEPSGLLLFSNRRSIPYRLAVRCPPLWVVTRFLAWFGAWLPVEWPRRGEAFYRTDVGIWLAHRQLWDECGGYDERMIYMNDMESDMVDRLMTRHPIVDLGERVGYDFFHLDHYHPRGSRSSSTHRTVNGSAVRVPLGYRPSGARWGLVDHPLGITSQRPGGLRSDSRTRSLLVEAPVTIGVAAFTAATATLDWLRYRVCAPAAQKWLRRFRTAYRALAHEPLAEWPAVLKRLWLDRPSGQAPRAHDSV